MGEVYCARDSRLSRRVAIKVLPEAFATDPERIARFNREAQLLAALNHPNIAAIYGFEEVERVRFLVLELVDGESLADRIRTSPGQRLTATEALTVSRQIIDALEAARHQRATVRSR